MPSTLFQPIESFLKLADIIHRVVFGCIARELLHVNEFIVVELAVTVGLIVGDFCHNFGKITVLTS